VSEILVRQFHLERATINTDEDGHTMIIRAVPWDVEVPIGPNAVESFDRSAFDAQMPAAHRVPIMLGHPSSHAGRGLNDFLIGRFRSMEAGTDGLMVEARVARTQAGEEALQLYHDGVLDEASIGFKDMGTRESRRGVTRVFHRMKAHLDHLALVPSGAYGEVGAKVLAVREVTQDTGPRLADLERWARERAPRS
jgi:HK97 family phage prohead protease